MVERKRQFGNRLRPGDAIGVVAPSSPVDREGLERGIALLRARGYEVVLGDHVYDSRTNLTYLAGEDAARAADLNRFFADSHIRALYCARGGYGCARLLPYVDWDLVRRNPKLVIGYSDITTLHLALEREAGLVTIHAKMLCTLDRLEEPYMSQLWRLLESDSQAGPLPATPASPVETLVGGTAEGELAGGCLCLLAHACGTPWAPDLRNRLVLIEDVGEPVYRIDRALTQLKLSGILEQAAGFIVGTVTDWRNNEPDPPRSTLEAVWNDLLLPMGKPTVTGFPLGHEPGAFAFPLGARARLDADARSVALLEPAGG